MLNRYKKKHNRKKMELLGFEYKEDGSVFYKGKDIEYYPYLATKRPNNAITFSKISIKKASPENYEFVGFGIDSYARNKGLIFIDKTSLSEKIKRF